MTNIFDYFNWRGDLSLKQDGFNEVDALVLSRLSYLPFDNIVSADIKEKISLRKTGDKFFSSDIDKTKILWRDDINLLKCCSESKRYEDMKLSGYVNIVDEKKQLQFSAVAIEISKNHYFISYRGTDNTVVGWQEDFNMYHTFPLPSQKTALKYLEEASKKLYGNLILGGHSKGGNLAVYASSFCKNDIRKRITDVYNYDGPGFDSKSIENSGFNLIIDKIHTYLPQSSIFGMMFEHDENYTIIKSCQKGFLQHDIYSWEVVGNKLVTLSEMTRTSAFFDHTLNEFLSTMSVEQRKHFADGVFSLLKNSDDKTFNEIADNWRANSAVVFKSFKNMDKETRSLILSSVLNFVKCAKNNFSDINPLSKGNKKSRKKS